MITVVYAVGVLWAVAMPFWVPFTGDAPGAAFSAILAYVAASYIAMMGDAFRRQEDRTESRHLYYGGFRAGVRFAQQPGQLMGWAFNNHVWALANLKQKHRTEYGRGLRDAYRATDALGNPIHDRFWRPGQ